ncbi:hypothetical protein ACFLXX_04075, partial [Chloroflexota bacterium]
EEELKEYLRSSNKTEEEVREEIRPLATKRVTQSLALGKVAEEEKVEVSGAEIDTDIQNMVKDAGEKKDELERFLNTPQARESIERKLLTRKTIQRLTDIARGAKGTKGTKKEEEK